MLLEKHNMLQRIFQIFLNLCIIAVLSGCVSSSLDDVGLDASNLSSPATLPVEQAVAGQVLTGPTSLNSAPNLVPNLVPGSVIALRENNLSNTPAVKSLNNNNDFSTSITPSINSGQNRQVGLATIGDKAVTTSTLAPSTPSTPNIPNINDIPLNRGNHFTADELRLKKALLRAEAQAAQGLITENELIQKRAQIATLRRKAGSHYQQAVRQISK